MNDNKFLSLVIDVGKILLKHIEQVQTPDDLLITYGKVAHLLPYDYNPRNLDGPLGALSRYCMELGLPLISTIVVNQDTLMPGAGYYKEFFPNTKEMQRPEIFVREFNHIKEWHDWTPLAIKLRI
jgi:hypothetical protein